MVQPATLATSASTSGWLRRARPWAIWSVCLAPVTIVVHELGHYSAAHLLGYPRPVLHFSGVDPGPSVGVPAAYVGFVALAGPLVSAALAIVGSVWIRRAKGTPLPAALTVTGVSRFAVSVPYTLVSAWVRLQERTLTPPVFDEYLAGEALGWSGDALLATTTLLFLGVVWHVNRAVKKGARMTAWIGLLSGTVVGWAAWMLVIGPWLLP
jgi:hypothetical protein